MNDKDNDMDLDALAESSYKFAILDNILFDNDAVVNIFLVVILLSLLGGQHGNGYYAELLCYLML